MSYQAYLDHIKHKRVQPDERFTAAGAWNTMVTHRVSLSDPTRIDAELIEWLQRAYQTAG